MSVAAQVECQWNLLWPPATDRDSTLRPTGTRRPGRPAADHPLRRADGAPRAPGQYGRRRRRDNANGTRSRRRLPSVGRRTTQPRTCWPGLAWARVGEWMRVRSPCGRWLGWPGRGRWSARSWSAVRLAGCRGRGW